MWLTKKHNWAPSCRFLFSLVNCLQSEWCDRLYLSCRVTAVGKTSQTETRGTMMVLVAAICLSMSWMTETGQAILILQICLKSCQTPNLPMWASTSTVVPALMFHTFCSWWMACKHGSCVSFIVVSSISRLFVKLFNVPSCCQVFLPISVINNPRVFCLNHFNPCCSSIFCFQTLQKTIRRPLLNGGFLKYCSPKITHFSSI